MNTKKACLILLAFAAVVWSTWSFAYQRGFTHGYSQGSRDEYFCWKQEPTTTDAFWDGTVTGRRDSRTLLGGKSAPKVVRVTGPTFEWDKQTGTIRKVK